MIGSIIQKKRKDAGMTQAQLAELLGVTAPAVNRWEKDLSFPDATLLAPLARCLKTDLNELFSFYDSLSDKERELIADRARTLLLLEDQDAALSYIDEAVKQNLSDGLLYKELAGVMLAVHTFKKASEPTIYLARIAAFYERAMELLPDEVENISWTLVTIYAAMGNREKAEEAWARLSNGGYDKLWTRAEMLYQLKDYDEALPIIRKLVLDKVIDLSQKLVFLGDTLYLNGDKEMAALAEELDGKVRKAFGLWRGFDVLNRITSAIETQPEDAEEVRLPELLDDDFSQDRITTCPLFDGVSLGGAPKGEGTTGDLMADILNVIQKYSKK